MEHAYWTNSIGREIAQFVQAYPEAGFAFCQSYYCRLSSKLELTTSRPVIVASKRRLATPVRLHTVV